MHAWSLRHCHPSRTGLGAWQRSAPRSLSPGEGVVEGEGEGGLVGEGVLLVGGGLGSALAESLLPLASALEGEGDGLGLGLGEGLGLDEGLGLVEGLGELLESGLAGGGALGLGEGAGEVLESDSAGGGGLVLGEELGEELQGGQGSPQDKARRDETHQRERGNATAAALLLWQRQGHWMEKCLQQGSLSARTWSLGRPCRRYCLGAHAQQGSRWRGRHLAAGWPR